MAGKISTGTTNRGSVAMSQNLLSQKQLAEALGVSSLTVIEWRRKGIITPKIHEGYVIKFNLIEVEEILAKRAKAKLNLPA